jgi:hypothetical protein
MFRSLSTTVVTPGNVRSELAFQHLRKSRHVDERGIARRIDLSAAG